MIKLINLLEDISDTKKRVPKDRLVYAWEFPEQNLAYIGLTGNENKRASDHTSLTAQKTTAVSRFLRETGVSWNKKDNYKILSATEENPSGYVSEDEAGRLECDYMKEYEKGGWELLNLAKCGSLGGSIRDEEAIINSVDNFVNSTDTSVDAGKLLSGSDYVKNYIEHNNQRDRVFNRIKDIIEKNNITSTKQLRRLEGEGHKRRLSKLIEDWSREHKEEDNWQRKLFPENTRGIEKPEEAAVAFLADLNNLDKEQLKLITKKTYKALTTPEQEKAFLDKFKKILTRYNVKSRKDFVNLTKDPDKVYSRGYSSPAWANLTNHDAEFKQQWVDLLFPGGYPGRGTGMPRKASVNESVDNREIIKQIVKSCCSR